LATVLVGLVLAGCAGAGARREGGEAAIRAARSGPPGLAPSRGYQHGDDDIAGDGIPGGNGDDIGAGEGDNRSTLRYGREAGAREARAVAAVVRGFYAAAATDDGARACQLIARPIAHSRHIVDLLPEAYRPAPGSSVLRGKSCAAVESLVFEVEQGQRVTESATLVVRAVRVLHDRAFALLGFQGVGERELQLRREAGGWRVDALADRALP